VINVSQKDLKCRISKNRAVYGCIYLNYLILKMANKNKVSDKQIIEALKSCHGFQSQACKLLEKQLNISFSASAMSQRISASEEIKTALAEMLTADLDYAENKMWELIKEGNVAALLFFLKTKGKERGYAERRELTGSNGAPLQMGEVKIYIPDNGRDKNGD
jgi:hypothetical protein